MTNRTADQQAELILLTRRLQEIFPDLAGVIDGTAASADRLSQRWGDLGKVGLVTAYANLAEKTSRTADEQVRFVAVAEQLKTLFPDLKDKIDLTAESADNLKGAMEGMATAGRDAATAKLGEEWTQNQKAIQAAERQMVEARKEMEHPQARAGNDVFGGGMTAKESSEVAATSYEAAKKKLEELQTLQQGVIARWREAMGLKPIAGAAMKAGKAGGAPLEEDAETQAADAKARAEKLKTLEEQGVEDLAKAKADAEREDLKRELNNIDVTFKKKLDAAEKLRAEALSEAEAQHAAHPEGSSEEKAARDEAARTGAAVANIREAYAQEQANAIGKYEEKAIETRRKAEESAIEGLAESRANAIKNEQEREIAMVKARYEKEVKVADEAAAELQKQADAAKAASEASTAKPEEKATLMKGAAQLQAEASAAADPGNAQRRALADKLAQDIANINQKHTEELAKSEKNTDEELAQARVEATMHGLSKQRALLDIEHRRKIQDAIEEGRNLDSLHKIDEVYRLKQQALTAAQETSGLPTFDVRSLQSADIRWMGAKGNDSPKRTADNTDRMVDLLGQMLPFLAFK